jgi:transcription elongation factor Elf1
MDRKKKYGITKIEYQEMVDATPHCPICGSEEPLVVDHDHSTSKVRGLICNHCNLVLGHAKDNIETLKNAIKYLEQ